jgi:hypothetical protein
MVFAYKGGKVRDTRIGELSEPQLRIEIRKIAG